MRVNRTQMNNRKINIAERVHGHTQTPSTMRCTTSTQIITWMAVSFLFIEKQSLSH